MQVKIRRDEGQVTAGIGSSYCGGKVIPKGEAIGHTMGCWVWVYVVRGIGETAIIQYCCSHN